MKTTHRNDPDLNKFLRNCSGLALVPLEKVEIAFANLLNKTPDVPKINEFTDYLVVNYIEQDALFPIKLWNHWEHEEKRTDKICSQICPIYFQSKVNFFSKVFESYS